MSLSERMADIGSVKVLSMRGECFYFYFLSSDYAALPAYCTGRGCVKCRYHFSNLFAGNSAFNF